MSYVAKRVIQALVEGTDLKLGCIRDEWRVVVANKEVRYRGAKLFTYGTSLFDSNDHYLSVWAEAKDMSDPFVIHLINAALAHEGYTNLEASTKDGKLIINNGLWEDEFVVEGRGMSMSLLQSYMVEPNYVRWHKEEGKSTWLLNHYEEHQKYQNLRGFCMTYGLSEQQALYGFKVAEEHLASIAAQ